VNNNKTIAIITARGGSKRIPRKNIKLFCGQPIINYSIIAALESRLFDEVMVSTDDIEIAEHAKKMGANVPFMRSVQNSNDFAGTADVICEVIEAYNSIGINFEKGCCIYPTAPFLSPKTLKIAFEIFIENSFDVVFPAIQYSYPIQRSIRLLNNGKVEMLWPENYSKRSQDFEPIFHDVGQFYWFNSQTMLVKKRLFTDNTGIIEIGEMISQDIDNEEDWQLAELKFKKLIKSKI
jgi:pseudaminic acid cytidylyltransferase